jgi:hypothetical protein
MRWNLPLGLRCAFEANPSTRTRPAGPGEESSLILGDAPTEVVNYVRCRAQQLVDAFLLASKPFLKKTFQEKRNVKASAAEYSTR